MYVATSAKELKLDAKAEVLTERARVYISLKNYGILKVS